MQVPQLQHPTTDRSIIQAVIFDLDGTLLDTEALSCQAGLDAFGPSLPIGIRQQHAVLPWELKKRILGMRGSEWIPIVIQYAHDHWGVRLQDEESNPDETNNDHGNDNDGSKYQPVAPSVEEFWNRWENGLNDLCAQVKECKGGHAIVDAFDTWSLPLAIATSSRMAAVQRKRIQHESMFGKFHTIVTGDQVPNGKPAPDMYLEAARRLGVDPPHCLAFEDSVTGCQSAKAAGCIVIAVPDPRMDKSDFAPVSDLIIDTLLDFDGSPWGLPLSIKNATT